MKKSKAVSLTLSLFIFFILILPIFFSAQKNFLLQSSRIIWSLFISLIGYFIFCKGKISFLRSLIFIICAWGFLLFFKAHLLGFLQISQRQATPFCHIAMVSGLLHFFYNQYLALSSGNYHIWGYLSLGFLWLLLTLLIGQAFCSWVCFYGGLDEGFSRILKRPLLRIKIPARLRDFPAALLIFVIIISFLSGVSIFCLWICPFKFTSEFLDYQPFIKNIQTFLFVGIAILFLVVFPLVMKKRTFCSFLCPFGAWQAFVGQLNPYRVSIDKEKCTKCNLCIEVCPVFAITPESLDKQRTLNYCNRCGACIDACPQKAIEFTFLGKGINLSKHAPRFLKEIIDVRVAFIFSCLLFFGSVSGLFMPQLLERIWRTLF